jgi:serine/threonine-protein kinase
MACLHEGEHGEVWRVEDPDGRGYALKFVTSDDPAVRAGLEHEARLHSLLHHHGVVPLRKTVTGPDGHTGLLMDFIEGPTLADMLDELGPPPLDRAVALFQDIVRAVRAIHARGIVHRDLKPENIVLHTEGDTVRPVLLDFGLAKRLATDGVSPPEQGMSMWFTTLGTPEYMAPEQATAPGEVDERADLFCLGCLLYELLTGRVAFDAVDPDEAMSAAATGRYEPVEDIMSVPEPLARLVRELLHPDPDRRPQHCTALLRRLDGSHPS